MNHADQLFFAEVARRGGYAPPEFDILGSDTPPRALISAAVIATPRLILVSARTSGRGGELTICEASRVFELSGRSTYAAQDLLREVSGYVTVRKIKQLFLRVGAASGNYSNHGYAYKIEAILQLIAPLTVTMVNTNSVGSWGRKAAPELPVAPPLELGARWAKKQLDALETAAFVAQHRSCPRFYFDGEREDG